MNENVLEEILAFLKNNFNGVDRKDNFLSTDFSSDGVSIIFQIIEYFMCNDTMNVNGFIFCTCCCTE